MLDTYTRGQKIGFTATFIDANGNSVTPSGATLRIVYAVNGVETTTDYTMTMDGASAKYNWSSKGADRGKIEWFIYPAGSSEATSQGYFLLKANKANVRNYNS